MTEAPSRHFRARDLAVATVIALVMGTVFVTMSRGRSLWVTFLPGLVAAWLLFAWIFIRRIELPKTERFTPVFLVTLAIQFLHFAEEHAKGFISFFAIHYGGTPYDDVVFTNFNMIAYALFTLGYVLGLYKGLLFLLMPTFFFITSGALGNAIWHTVWQIEAGEYTPGFYSAQLYWVAAPWCLSSLLGSVRHAVIASAGFAAVLVPILLVFAE